MPEPTPAEPTPVQNEAYNALMEGLAACATTLPCYDHATATADAVAEAVEPHYTIAALEQAATSLDQLAELNSRQTRGTTEGPWIVAGIQAAALNVRDQIRALRSDLEGTTTHA
ncbi:hypothetical protein GCM10027447_12640 [Glycomyces halotolerans]